MRKNLSFLKFSFYNQECINKLIKNLSIHSRLQYSNRTSDYIN